MKKFFKIFLWCLLGAAVLGTFYFLYQNSKSEPEVYENVRPYSGEISRTAILTGKIEPRDEINIKPQISGIITDIVVEPGQAIRAGDVIALIQVIPDASQLSSAQSRLNSARIDLTAKHLVFSRDSALFAARVISREEYETSDRNYRLAAEEADAAEDALNIVRSGVSSLNADESSTMVRATIDGIVLDVPVQVGSSVIQANTFNDGTTIATIADMSKLVFKGNVDETEVGRLRVGMPVNISIGAAPELSPEAFIEYISPKGNDASGANTFEIKAALDLDGDHGLRAGYSANATVVLQSSGPALLVPERVVEFAGDSTFVYVLADSLATPAIYERTAVETGVTDGLQIQICSGVDSTALLRGSKIR